MKILVLIFTLFLSLGATPMMGQTYSPGKQCRVLVLKRKNGIRHPKPRYRVARNKNKFKGAESVASSAPEKRPQANNTSKPPVAAAAAPKKRKQEHAEEETLVDKDAIIFNGQSQAGEKEAIEEEVNQRIAEIKDGDSIVLDPVYIKDNNGQLEIVNMKPVLMAAEYGKKGRQVEVNGNIGSPEETNVRVERFKDMLVSMGVSPELITTSNSSRALASASNGHIDFIVH